MARYHSVALIAALGGIMVESQGAPAPEADRKAVDAEAVAKLPHPGTVTAGAIAFTPDGRAVTYLKSESPDSLSRVLWRVGVEAGREPRVVARPPEGGVTEANVSPEEALRRERQRLRDTGIAQIVRAEEADVAIIPLKGDLYLQRGDGPLVRLTETEAPEIDPQLSRDGSRVAFVREGELHVIDVETGRETRLTRGAEEGLTHGLAEFIAQEELDRSSGFWWAPDGSRIAYQETDERHVPAYSIVHQGGEQYSVETHRYPFAGAANARVRLGVVAVGGGETKWLTLAPPDEDFYLARVEWEDPKTLLVQVLSRDQKSLRLVRIDVEDGRRTVLIEDRSDTWINLHDDLRVVDRTGELLWSSERTGFRHLELRDRDGRLIRMLTSGEWPVDSPTSGRGFQGVVALDQGRREVWFVAAKDGPTQAHAYRVSLDGGPIVRVTRGEGTHRVVVARDGEHFVDVASGRKAPPVTTLRDRSGRALGVLDDAGKDPRIAQLDLAPPELTEFKNRDGVTLHGAYYAPKTRVIGPKAPLVVMVYGGPGHQLVLDSWALTADLAAQYLAERGFAVWKMDNRGTPRRGHAFEAALYHAMGDVEVRDQVDGVKFVLTSRPEVDARRVGITGGSYGGYMTLRCLAKAPDVFRAGVAVAPVTDWDGYDTAYTERYMGTPADNPDGYEASSVLPVAGDIAGSLMVIHGMLDENVHFRHTARLTTALIASARPFDLLPLPDERHSSRREADRRYVAERTADFFDLKLGKND